MAVIVEVAPIINFLLDLEIRVITTLRIVEIIQTRVGKMDHISCRWDKEVV